RDRSGLGGLPWLEPALDLLEHWASPGVVEVSQRDSNRCIKQDKKKVVFSRGTELNFKEATKQPSGIGLSLAPIKGRGGTAFQAGPLFRPGGKVVVERCVGAGQGKIELAVTQLPAFEACLGVLGTGANQVE